MNRSTQAALEALAHGYVAIPIKDGGKHPYASNWTHTRWDPYDTTRLIEAFTAAQGNGATSVGLLLGEPSRGLIDIDLDHPKASLLREYFLPPTAMRSGRVGHPVSHMWYRIEATDETPLPATRRHKMPGGSVSVEFRSTGSQTLIPPSLWWPKDPHPAMPDQHEVYRWEGEPWGGEAGPTVIGAAKLQAQTALLGLGCVLIDKWPLEGGRHDAYLALAGALLRYGHAGVHPWWERQLPVLIAALAGATFDRDGGDARVKEVLNTTINRLRSGQKVVGLTRLGEILGTDYAEQVRRMVHEVEQAAGVVLGPMPSPIHLVSGAGATSDEGELEIEAASSQFDGVPLEDRDPLVERGEVTWQAVDLDPYLSGEVSPPRPTVLQREDGESLFYQGRVNSLYGRPESAKSWVALIACAQEMVRGDRVVYLDLEDEPVATLDRLLQLGVGAADIRGQFGYVRPENALAMLQRNKWGEKMPTEKGAANQTAFDALLESIDPSLIVVDGMTVLYGIHGLDTNDAASTDVIIGWLKGLTRGSRSTVIVIDHTGKGAQRGATPLGSQHKMAMVQGSALQLCVVEQPYPGNPDGEMELVVGKDRPGAVRKVSTKVEHPVAAIVRMDSSIPGIVRATVEVPDPDRPVVDLSKTKVSKTKAPKVKPVTERDTAEKKILKMFMTAQPGTRLRMPEVQKRVPAVAPTTVRQTVGVMVAAHKLVKHQEGPTPRDVTYALPDAPAGD